MTKMAVTGTFACGKTMFLTSLLWQLEELDETRFHLPDGVAVRGFHPQDIGNRDEVFPLNRFRNTLAREYEWPEKTKDTYHYRHEFHRTDRWRIRKRQTVDYLDFPGERIADVAMVIHEDFGEWSDHLLDNLSQDSFGGKVATQFKTVATSPGTSTKDIVLAYRRALAQLIRNYKPLVSPSVFLLGRNGDTARNEDETRLVAYRRCGLDEEREFAPLPRELRDANPKLVDEMQRHFREYRKEVVLPLFRDLMSVQSLIVLIDIPTLLLAGDQRFGDERQIIVDLLKVVCSDTFASRILRTLRLRSSLQRVAFVASKSDLVLEDDLRNGRLLGLLRSMNNRAVQQIKPSVKVKWFTCSACVSTRAGSKRNMIVGQMTPGPYAENRHDVEVEISQLPEQWPHSWKQGDYLYQRFWPRVPENFMIPPRHRNLDDIFNFTVLG